MPSHRKPVRGRFLCVLAGSFFLTVLSLVHQSVLLWSEALRYHHRRGHNPVEMLLQPLWCCFQIYHLQFLDYNLDALKSIADCKQRPSLYCFAQGCRCCQEDNLPRDCLQCWCRCISSSHSKDTGFCSTLIVAITEPVFGFICCTVPLS